MKTTKVFPMSVCVMLLLGAFASAQDRDERREWGGEHPHYLRALSDLREARGTLSSIDSDVPFYPRVVAIMRDIDAAMHEIADASISDGRNLDDFPPPDPTWDRRGRLMRASDLLDRAHEDIANTREPNDFARGLKHRADNHVENARHRIQDLMHQLAERREWQERREEHEERRGY